MKFSVFFLGCVALTLAGCTVPQIAATGATAYMTKPADLPPADTADQIPQHESWCYSTAGDAECYAHPQDVPPERLINVDPESRYPVDLEAYRALVAKKVAAAPETVQPVAPPPLPPTVLAVKAAPLAAVKPPIHHAKKGKPHAKARKSAKTHKPHTAHADDGKTPAIPPGKMPISLQPSATTAPSVDLQDEKNKLQNEIGSAAPAPAPVPWGTALPTPNAEKP